ncbi:copper-translocating P-type ATPase [Oenococcus oeni]|uniref:copper-translocating P-type ATPase n=2 Tax=Oenococcus oeni TaxID=1247 RepID=UPI0008F919D7|nr:copper-translocating P-type ATPase [Oenococcus oeni]OIK85641.1 copper-translocating P-type ATPase [Oenococcus oeni]OIL11849.1 copper-translocating P-type ATPase [Oenococcus oeni]
MKMDDMKDMKMNNMEGMKMDHGNMKMSDETSRMDHQMSHEDMMMSADFKSKFWVSLVLTIPVLLMSDLMGLLSKPIISFPRSVWLSAIIASVIFFYGGGIFIKHARMELQMKKPAMMSLISMAIIVAYLYSIYTSFAGVGMDFWLELTTLIDIMLLGHWVEQKATAKAGDSFEEMAALLPSEATVLHGDMQMKMPLSEVKNGQVVLVKAGEKIPVDGRVVDGKSSVNESMVTGESRPINKQTDSKVIGGSLNGDGSLKIKVTATGDSGFVSQVMEMISKAQQQKSRSESLADKVASWLFYIALAVGLITFVIWYAITRDFSTSIERLVTVLVIACPHALGLAIPLVIARSTSIGARNGLLVRNRQAIENAPKINILAIDKTGTLTEGNFAVKEYTNDQVLTLAASLEQNSNHPLAKSIVSFATRKKLKLKTADQVKNISGAGLQGIVDGKQYLFVSSGYLNNHHIFFDKKEDNRLSAEGNSISYLIYQDRVLGFVAQGDQIRTEAKQFISGIGALNIKVVMLTGDNQGSAKAVANQLGIKYFHAQLLPDDKEKIIENYLKKGNKLAMVGDGINDAPSLTRADIGIAIGAGTDVAVDSADVVLVKSNPFDILRFLKLARSTMKKLVENLWWGAGYNLIAIPLAAGVLAPIGIVLSPAVGAILMALSTVIVAINAMTLKAK